MPGERWAMRTRTASASGRLLTLHKEAKGYWSRLTAPDDGPALLLTGSGGWEDGGAGL